MRGRKFLTPEYQGSLEVGQDLVIAGHIALEGTLEILKRKEAVLKEQFSGMYLEQISSLQNLLVDENQFSFSKDNCTFVSSLGAEGIMAGLWQMAEFFQKGLVIDLKKIPLKQETIEVTELFEINPYRLQSKGSFLMAAYHGGDLVKTLQLQGLVAKVIGKVEDGISRKIFHGDTVSYLDRPVKDEIWKVL